MEFEISPAALRDTTQWVARMAPAKPAMPILAGMIIDTASGNLVCETFDYEVSARATSTAATRITPGRALVAARLWDAVVKALPNKPATIRAGDGSVEVVCGSSRFTLPTMTVEDYPALPTMGDLVGEVDAAGFLAAVGAVAVAVCRDSTLPMLTAVSMTLGSDSIRMAATDRYRLSTREIPWDGPEVERHVLIPGKTLESLKNMSASGIIGIHTADDAGHSMVGFSADGRMCTTSTMAGEYPPVARLIPDTHNTTITFAVPELLDAAKRVALVASKSTPIRVTASGDTAVVEAAGEDSAKASEAISCRCDGVGPVTVAFNAQYLVDGLTAAAAGTVTMRVLDAKKPVVLTAGDPDASGTDRYLIMPVRT